MAGALRPGGSGRLVYLLGRYYEAIEADLALRGWDLAELWKARRWRFLLNIINHLPGDSYFVAAMADDEDLAEQAPEPKPGPPPLTDFTPEVQRLTLIADRLGELITAVHNTVAKKPQKPPPRLPRPETAHDRIRRRRRSERHQLIRTRLRQAAAAGRPTMAAGAHTDPKYAAARPRRGGPPPGSSHGEVESRVPS